MSDIQDIGTWREAHLRLTLAIAQSKDNISKELATRRYLLEEITRCKAASGMPPKRNESKATKKKPVTAAKKEEEKKEVKSKPGEKAAKKIPNKRTVIPPKNKIDTKNKQAVFVKKQPATPVAKKQPAVKVNPKPNPISSEAAQALKSMAQGIGGGGVIPGHDRKLLHAVIGSGKWLNDATKNSSAQVPKNNPDPK